MAGYQSTVLNALGKVEDALNALQADAGTLQTQVQAEQAAASSRAVVENPYRDPDLDWGGAGVP